MPAFLTARLLQMSLNYAGVLFRRGENEMSDPLQFVVIAREKSLRGEERQTKSVSDI
jgi:hypothetical protein